MINLNEFAKKLKELRKSNKMTQQDLAQELNISQMQISRYETGKDRPSLSLLERLSGIFGVTLDALSGNSSSSDDNIKSWTEHIVDDRLKLLDNPEGVLEYQYFAGKDRFDTKVAYTFGIIPGEVCEKLLRESFKSPFDEVDDVKIDDFRFIYIKEIEGKFFQTMLETGNDLFFWALVGWLGNKLCLGNVTWRPSKEKSHAIMQLVMDNLNVANNPLSSSMSQYVQIYPSNDAHVKAYAVDGIYSLMLKTYLGITVEERIRQLNNYRKLAFTW